MKSKVWSLKSRVPFKLNWVWMALIWLVMLLGAAVWQAAGMDIVRDPLTRPVLPHWADLGSTNYPFKAIYADSLYLGGVAVSGTNWPTVGLSITQKVVLFGSSLTNTLAFTNVFANGLLVASGAFASAHAGSIIMPGGGYLIQPSGGSLLLP